MVDEHDREVLTWVAWARLQVDGLSSTARLALLEIAGLVDTAGAAIVEVYGLLGGWVSRSVTRGRCWRALKMLVCWCARPGVRMGGRARLASSWFVGSVRVGCELRRRCLRIWGWISWGRMRSR